MPVSAYIDNRISLGKNPYILFLSLAGNNGTSPFSSLFIPTQPAVSDCRSNCVDASHLSLCLPPSTAAVFLLEAPHIKNMDYDGLLLYMNTVGAQHKLNLSQVLRMVRALCVCVWVDYT